MMNNLFIMFDPSSNFLNLNWLAVFLPLFIFNKTFYKFSKISRMFLVNSLLTKFIIQDLKNNLIKSTQKNFIFLVSFFSFIMFSNFLSIFPFIFTPTSHLSLNLSLSFPFWLSLFFMSWIKTTNKTFSHLVPSNTPLLLCPFMVLIETISNIIRPLTLAIRLTANMVAGHILISLLSNMLNNKLIIFLVSSILLNFLLILEFSVALIQAYVFVILLSLYMTEVIS